MKWVKNKKKAGLPPQARGEKRGEVSCCYESCSPLKANRRQVFASRFGPPLHLLLGGACNLSEN